MRRGRAASALRISAADYCTVRSNASCISRRKLATTLISTWPSITQRTSGSSLDRTIRYCQTTSMCQSAKTKRSKCQADELWRKKNFPPSRAKAAVLVVFTKTRWLAS
jgi:hypothetical protein